MPSDVELVGSVVEEEQRTLVGTGDLFGDPGDPIEGTGQVSFVNARDVVNRFRNELELRSYGSVGELTGAPIHRCLDTAHSLGLPPRKAAPNLHSDPSGNAIIPQKLRVPQLQERQCSLAAPLPAF